MRVICYKWGECDVLWKNANWLWSECALVDEIGLPPLGGIPGELALPSWLQDDKAHSPQEIEKRKRFIRLICKVKGEPDFDKRKEKKDIKISIDDIKLVVKAVKNIDIKIIED